MIDEQVSRQQFTLYIKYDKEKLLGFLQKIDTSLFSELPDDSEQQCEKAGLFVEQAFILLEKQNEQKALKILMSQTNSLNIEKCIMLAIRHKLIDTLVQKMIEDANKDTAKLNILL